MILSMTGFAAEAAELPGLSLAVELRSVNHRYLDVTVKLPDELRHLESALRERLSGALKRGKVECRVTLSRASAGATTLAVDAARVEQLASAAAQVLRTVPAASPLSVIVILRWPGVMAEPSVPPEEPICASPTDGRGPVTSPPHTPAWTYCPNPSAEHLTVEGGGLEIGHYISCYSEGDSPPTDGAPPTSTV